MDDRRHDEETVRAFQAAQAVIPGLRLDDHIRRPWFYQSLLRNYTVTMSAKAFEAARAEVRALVQGLRVAERLDETSGFWYSGSNNLLTAHLRPFQPFFATLERRALLREAIDQERARLAPEPLLPGSDRFFKGLLLRTLNDMVDHAFRISSAAHVTADHSADHEARFFHFMNRASLRLRAEEQRKRKREAEEAAQADNAKPKRRRPARASVVGVTAREEEEMASAAF